MGGFFQLLGGFSHPGLEICIGLSPMVWCFEEFIFFGDLSVLERGLIIFIDCELLKLLFSKNRSNDLKNPG